MMKSNIYLLFTMISIALISCSKENIENSNSNLVQNKQPSRYFIADKVVIGNQIWATQNLNVTWYRNGDAIPQVQDPHQWENLTTGAWCYYANNSVNGPIYGKLYNWYAVIDQRGLAPAGFHVPNSSEWITLVNFLGGIDVAGGALKSTNLWLAPNTGATNSSGFSAVPSGQGVPIYNLPVDFFQNLGYLTLMFCNDSFTNLSQSKMMYIDCTSSGAGISNIGNLDKNGAYAVRCIKN